jgi:hypothetical protein
MSEVRLQAELTETKLELQRLRERMLAGTPTVHNDLSLIALVPKWSSSESTVTLEEFFSSIQASARIGRWEEKNQLEIAVLKLTDSAKLFHHGYPEIHAEDVTWDKFKKAFRQRFRDLHNDQFHYMKLQTARQAKTEDPQQSADRCRALAQKIVCKVDDPVSQRIHHENAERMLLAAFVNGLSGTPGRQVPYANPQTVDQALKIALSVQEAERHERFSERFIQISISQLDYCPNPPSVRLKKTADRGTQLKRIRSITHAVSEMRVLVVSTGQ